MTCLVSVLRMKRYSPVWYISIHLQNSNGFIFTEYTQDSKIAHITCFLPPPPPPMRERERERERERGRERGGELKGFFVKKFYKKKKKE